MGGRAEEVTIEKFIHGCMRLRGAARSIDLMMLSKELESQRCGLMDIRDYQQQLNYFLGGPFTEGDDRDASNHSVARRSSPTFLRPPQDSRNSSQPPVFDE